MSRRKYGIILLLLLSQSYMAQDLKTVRDFGVWANLGIDYKLNKNWRLSLDQEARFFDNASKLDRVSTELGVKYKINDQFRLGANARYSYDRKATNLFTNDLRFSVDFEYRVYLKEKFRFDYRLRYQNHFIKVFTYQDEKYQKADLRNRVEARYLFTKHALVVSAELFREYIWYRKPYFNGIRFLLGDEVKTDLGKFEYSFNYARELNADYPLNAFFISLSYTFSLKHE